jgi:hypothetical protein
MAFHHVFVMESCNQWAKLIHVLNAFVKSNKRLIVLNLFVCREKWSGLLIHHFLDQGNKVISIDGVPKLLLP